MKKILFCAVASMMVSLASFAGNICKITTDGIEAGKTGVVTISLENDNNVDAFNFNIVLPEGLTIEDYDTTDRTWISKKDNFTVTCDNKEGYYLVIGYTVGTPMKATDEDKSIVTFKVKAADTFTGGVITLNTVKFSYDGKSDETTIVGGDITAVNEVEATAPAKKAVKFLGKNGDVVIVSGNKSYNAAAAEVK